MMLANSTNKKSSESVLAHGGSYPKHKLLTMLIKNGYSTRRKVTSQQIKNFATVQSQLCFLNSSIVFDLAYFVIDC